MKFKPNVEPTPESAMRVLRAALDLKRDERAAVLEAREEFLKDLAFGAEFSVEEGWPPGRKVTYSFPQSRWPWVNWWRKRNLRKAGWRG